ncbi:HET-domain-containing protein, partial [Ophiobolus disseminans]
MSTPEHSDSSCAPTPASWVESCGNSEEGALPAEEAAATELDRRPWLATPLSPDRPQIRVIKLQRGSDDDLLTCDLSVASLDENPSYEVLSYVWGDASNTEEIAVGGVSFHATRNLADFLRCLRLPYRERTIWADAICINQSNQEEKSHQIGLMTDIYRHAEEAHVWFGPFNSDACYHEHDKANREYRVNRSWLLVIDCIRWLLLRPWWSRVWTLQEAVLPK